MTTATGPVTGATARLRARTGTTRVTSSQAPTTHSTTAEPNAVRVVASEAINPNTTPPVMLPTSKNIVNELIANGRSRSSARFTVNAISDGYRNADAKPTSPAAIHSAHALGNTARPVSATDSELNAISAALRTPRRSTHLAPAKRSSRHTTL